MASPCILFLHLQWTLHSVSSLPESLHTFCPAHPHLYIATTILQVRIEQI